MAATIAPPIARDAVPVTMRAVVQEGSGSADVLQLRTIDVPEPADGGVLVHVRAASINASDYHTIRGGRLTMVIGTVLLRRKQKLHPVRGGDLAGTIVAVGRAVTSLHPGDEVFGSGRGSWAEYVSASETTVVPKPANVSFAEAGAVSGAGSTALQAVRDHARIGPGKRALIYGCGGGVGTFAVQIAKALGAHVTAVTGTRNMEIARTLGADVLLDYNADDVATRGERYDAVIDIAGTRPLGELIGMVAPGGIFVLVGAAKGPVGSVIGRLLAAVIRKRVLKQPIAFFIANINKSDLMFLKRLIETGKIRPAIDRTYPLAETRDAVRYTMSGQARAKVILTVD